jgi:formylglycine-generating enzyme required for sulfatase activity
MAFADRLEAALQSRGFEVLIDRQEIYAFEDWWKRIEALLGSADTVVFVLSPDAVKSPVALKEVAHAASLNKRFAPIVCRRVEDGAVPEALARLNFIFFDDPVRFEASADRLAEALQTDIGWVRRHTEFGEAARRWLQAGRPGGLLLRPPILDQAEAWLAYRPRGAPPPTADTEAFITASRQAELAARRRSRMLHAALYTMFISIILGLVGWINQDYLKAQWRWYVTQRPFVAANIWPYVLAPAAEGALKPQQQFRECAAPPGADYCPAMVVVPAGAFMLGSAATEPGHFSIEEPLHKVSIAKAFAVSKTEVTFAEWDTCAAYGACNPDIDDNKWGRDQQPVVNVTWADAQSYVNWLSTMTGKPYRLLSEAEYEYAARAGTTTAYPWGDAIGKGNANCNACGSRWDGARAAPVGAFAPNRFGLYDMVGNVFEWVQDCMHLNYQGAPQDGSAWIAGGDCSNRIIRGGSFNSGPAFLRSASRNSDIAVDHNSNVGFRVVRTLDLP